MSPCDVGNNIMCTTIKQMECIFTMKFLLVLWWFRSCVKGRMGTLEDSFPLSGSRPVNCVTAAYQRFWTLPPPCYVHKRASGIIIVELLEYLSRKTSAAQNICVHTIRTEEMSLPHKNSFIERRMKPAKHWPQQIRSPFRNSSWFSMPLASHFGFKLFWLDTSLVWVGVTFTWCS